LGGGVAGRMATSGRYGPFRSVQGHAEWYSFSSQSRPPLPASDFENRSLSHDVRGAVRSHVPPRTCSASRARRRRRRRGAAASAEVGLSVAAARPGGGV